MISLWLMQLADRALELCDRIGWLPPLLIRLFVGYFFFETGWAKAHDLAIHPVGSGRAVAKADDVELCGRQELQPRLCQDLRL